jgi:flavorubredoxin
MNKTLKIIIYTGTIIALGWGILTWVVERRGPKKSWDMGNVNSDKKALIVFDPDPFYNFDEQVCLSVAEVLAENGMAVKVVSVAAADMQELRRYDVLVFCANTYNWSPDWALRDFIKGQESLHGKPVIAITLGAGSTASSKRKLEQLISSNDGKILGSNAFWLMRPNDEARMKESNVRVALSIVKDWSGTLVDEYLKTK